MREALRFTGIACQVTISKRAENTWLPYGSIRSTRPLPPTGNESVDLDFGIKDVAVCSNGKTLAANQKSRHSLKPVARKQRALSRKAKGSHRCAKASQAVSKLYYRIHNLRLAVLGI